MLWGLGTADKMWEMTHNKNPIPIHLINHTELETSEIILYLGISNYYYQFPCERIGWRCGTKLNYHFSILSCNSFVYGIESFILQKKCFNDFHLLFCISNVNWNFLKGHFEDFIFCFNVSWSVWQVVEVLWKCLVIIFQRKK